MGVEQGKGKTGEGRGFTDREICRPLDLRVLESLHAHVRFAGDLLVLLHLSALCLSPLLCLTKTKKERFDSNCRCGSPLVPTRKD